METSLGDRVDKRGVAARSNVVRVITGRGSHTKDWKYRAAIVDDIPHVLEHELGLRVVLGNGYLDVFVDS